MIFVSIASYRDPDTVLTIQCLLDRAHRPERIVVGVLWQNDPLEDPLPDLTSFGPPERLRSLFMPATEAAGPCHARHIIQTRLYEGEEYFLQLDSHMRAVPGWDDLLIAQLELCNSPNPVLTTYPAGFTRGAGQKWQDASLDTDERPPFLVFSHFGPEDGMMRFKGRRLRTPHSNPLPCHFCVSGFLFAPGRILKQGGLYDSNLPHLFFGEETLLSVRLWTHGWDFFVPGRHVFFHCWDRSYRPTFFASKNPEAQAASLERVRALLRGLELGEKFGCGAVREVHDYFVEAGLDFDSKAVLDAKRNWRGLDEADFVQNDAMANNDNDVEGKIRAVMAILRNR